MIVIACGLFLTIGSFFMFISSVGLIRFPDIYMRMSATAKAATFGTGFNLLAAAIYFEDLGITVRAFAALLFLLATAPVAAHVIARAAYISGVPLWKASLRDDLLDRYDPKSTSLSSPDDDGA